MKKMTIFVISLLFVSGGYANESKFNYLNYEMFKSQKVKTAPFYAVTKDGKVSYLLGTCHLGIHRDELHPLIMNKIKEARQAYFEKDETDISLSQLEADTQGSLQTKIERMEYLSQRANKKFIKNNESDTALLVSYGFQREIAERLFLDQPVDYDFVLAQDRFPSPLPVDVQLQSYAIKNSVKVHGLEDRKIIAIANQYESYFSSSEVESEDSEPITLRQYFNTPEDVERYYIQMNSIITKYRNGDIAPVSKMLTPLPEEDYTNYMSILRNYYWISTTEKEWIQGNIFMAVGLGHLQGDNGLIAMLLKKGFSVELVPQF